VAQIVIGCCSGWWL